MRSFVWAAAGTCFTFVMTALGAALVFFFKSRPGGRMNRLCLGFAGGVMSAAAVFSLLLPAMEQAQSAPLRLGAPPWLSAPPWLVATVGFSVGAGLMLALDARLCSGHGAQPKREADKKRMLLFSAVTLHNIPEGIAVGLAFAVAAGSGGTGLAGACALALGVGIQNFPEGAAISLPLRQSGMSRRRSFYLGVLSGAVEPLFGMLAALLTSALRPALPWLMAFAAGAMMWVVFSEMLSEAGKGRDGVLAALVGYAVMMALDAGLG